MLGLLEDRRSRRKGLSTGGRFVLGRILGREVSIFASVSFTVTLTSKGALVGKLSAVNHTGDMVSDLPFAVLEVISESGNDTRIVAADDHVGRAEEC